MPIPPWGNPVRQAPLTHDPIHAPLPWEKPSKPPDIRNSIFAECYGNELLGIKRLPLKDRMRIAVNVPDGWNNIRLTEEVILLKKEIAELKTRLNSRIKIYQMEDLKRYER